MTTTCPRCGTGWGTLDPCPSCGYEPEHPGVLGAFGQALGSLASHPGLLLAYLVPAGILLAAQLLLLDLDTAQGTPGLTSSLASLVAVYLHIWWLLIAVSITTTRLHPDHPGPMLGPVTLPATALAALIATVPWGLLGGLVAWSPTGSTGAIAQLAVLIVLLLSVLITGRMVGVPVEAGLGARSTSQALSQGNRRAKENGGLGFIFLLGLAILAVSLARAIATVTGVIDLSLTARLSLTSGALWILEAWTGVAIVHGFSAFTPPQTTFACPRCGAQATAQGGRAACQCGLEGPYYDPAERAPR